MVHYQADYIFGCVNQKRVLPIITKYFNRDISENIERYSKYDFTDTLYNYELKTRKNTLNKYADTMITLNKLTSSDKRLILLFSFTDKLAYIEYNEDIFKNFRTCNFSRANLEYDKKIHIYIPIELLTIIE